MEIKVYAPVDCEVKTIDKCSDPIFAQKMMGEGILIIPRGEDFYSPFSEADIAVIFETKHAYGFQLNGLSSLLHCGIDTVKFNGAPFQVFVNLNEKVHLDSKIFQVNLKYLQTQNVSIETPLIFENPSDKILEVSTFKEKMYKKGEYICSIKLKQKELKAEEFFSGITKYDKAYDVINTAVGSSNYTKVYNCMTRLRFTVINKALVNTEAIKNFPLVKGVVWNGFELQVVIGQDVYKLRETFEKRNSVTDNIKNNDQEHLGVFKKLLQMFGGIMVQIIPVFIGAGLLQAIVSMLNLAGLIPSYAATIDGLEQIKNVSGFWDIIGLMLMVTSKSTSIVLGILIAYSAAKYFDLRPILGVALGVILCSPILFVGGGPIGFGGTWTLFSFGTPNTSDPELNNILKSIFNVTITPGFMKIFVAIGTVYLAKKLDDWIGAWVPSIIELTVRPLLVILISGMVGLCLFMPVWNILEGVISLLMYYIGKAPLGIGIGVYTALWQVAVVFGVHMALAIVAITQANSSIALGNGGYQTFNPGSSVAVWAQVGALIGIVLVTRNKDLKRKSIELIPVGVLGITEPILYGITLPKKRPFIAAITAAFFAGCVVGMANVTTRVNTGLGIFEAIGYFQYTPTDYTGSIAKATGQLSILANGLWYLGCCGIALGLGALFTALIYKERRSEKTIINQFSRNIVKFLALQFVDRKDDVIHVKNDLAKISGSILSNDDIKSIKACENQILKLITLQTNLQALIEKDEKRKAKIMAKGTKLVANKKIEQAESLKRQYSIPEVDNKIADLRRQIDLQKTQIDYKQYHEIIAKVSHAINQEVDNISKEFKLVDTNVQKLKNTFDDEINSMLIEYDLKQKREVSQRFLFHKEIQLLKQQQKKA